MLHYLLSKQRERADNMVMTPKGYRQRIIDGQMNSMLKAFGGVLILGPKWCGKTWTALNHAQSVAYLDDESTERLALLDAKLVLEGEKPRLIDEWQIVPTLWDQARRHIDAANTAGQLIFTGSTLPPSKKTKHSGTGRFARIEMKPFTLYESGESSGSVSLGELFRGEAAISAKSDMDYQRIISLICRGGWPEALHLTGDDTLLIPREYIKSIVNNEAEADPELTWESGKMKVLLQSIARNNATSAKIATLFNDIRSHTSDETLSEVTISKYLEALRKLYMLTEISAWKPSLRSKARIRTSAKRHFVDPSLAVAALGASPRQLSNDPETAGFFFESLCLRDLGVYVQQYDGTLYHYQDSNGLEADIVVQLADGRWALIECKLGSFEWDQAAYNLIRLSNQVGQMHGAPSFLMILTATGGAAFTRSDGVHIVPIDCLRP